MYLPLPLLLPLLLHGSTLPCQLAQDARSDLRVRQPTY